jgi:hypothetical protein
MRWWPLAVNLKKKSGKKLMDPNLSYYSDACRDRTDTALLNTLLTSEVAHRFSVPNFLFSLK